MFHLISNKDRCIQCVSKATINHQKDFNSKHKNIFYFSSDLLGWLTQKSASDLPGTGSSLGSLCIQTNKDTNWAPQAKELLSQPNLVAVLKNKYKVLSDKHKDNLPQVLQLTSVIKTVNLALLKLVHCIKMPCNT